MNQHLEITTGYEKFRKYYRSLEPFIEKPKNRIYTAVIFSFLAIALFALYAIKPTIQTIIFLQRDIADKTVLNNQMEEKINSLVLAQASYEEAKDRLPLLDEAIPNAPEALDAILQIKNLISASEATMSSVRVSDISLIPNKPETSEKISTKSDFDISMNVEGIYQDIEKFLLSLQTMRRIVTIDQINFTPTTANAFLAQPTGKILKLTVQLKAYYK